MFEKYKNGITFFSILSIIAILFPPVIWETNTRIFNTGFSFLFSIPKYKHLNGNVNFGMLLLELFIILILSILFQLYFNKIKKIYKGIIES